VYRLKFTSSAEANLARIDKPIARLIYRRLHWLADNFEFITPIPLKGEFKEFNKFQVGDYRALYTADPGRQMILVHFIQHRREVYRSK